MKISRQGFEKRVVSQDLQLWLSNVSFRFYMIFLCFWALLVIQVINYLSYNILGTTNWWSIYPPCSGRKTGIFLNSLSFSLFLSLIEKSFLLRCKKYNFLPHLIKRESKGHCSEYWSVYHELVFQAYVVQVWNLLQLLIY